MRDYILRMTACEIPVATAIKIYADFKRRGKLVSLKKYIKCVEAIQSGRIETV